MQTIITVRNPAVGEPSQEYLQYVQDTYITPGKLVVEQQVDPVTGYSTSKLQFASNEAYAEFKADPTILAGQQAGQASVIKTNIYRTYQQPI